MPEHYQSCPFPETGKDCRCEIGRYKRAVGITFTIFLVQLISVWLTNNLALRADTFHVSSDLFVNIGSLIIACLCLRANKTKENLVRGVFSFFGILLLFGGGFHILFEAYDRLRNPDATIAWPVIFVAAIGAVGNYLAHRILSAAPADCHNSTHRVLSAHVLSDLFCSLAVIISAAAVFFLGLAEADPYISILIAGYIFFLSGRLFSGFSNETRRYKLLSFVLVCAAGLSFGHYSVITGVLLFLAGFCFSSKHEECCH